MVTLWKLWMLNKDFKGHFGMGCHMGFLRSWLMVVMPGTAAPKRVARTAGKRDTGAMVEISRGFHSRQFPKNISVSHLLGWKKNRDGSNIFFGGSDTFRKMDKQITTFGTSSYWWSQRPSTHRPKCRGRGVEPKPNPGLQSFGGIGV